MLSWAFKRNDGGNAQTVSSADDTQIDQPDTPAPVFAVRALKTALFGTPATREFEYDSNTNMAKGKMFDSIDFAAPDAKSPSRPPGILLTPGTGTSRRKTVSFDQHAKAGAAVKTDSQSGLPDDCPGKFPSPWVGHAQDKLQSRPKTRLTEALEKSRKVKLKTSSTEAKAPAPEPRQTQEDEDLWEEVDDLDRDPDMTVDLNEPHSRSGKYWKSYFEQYHAEAKAEMEKLVKYKQLAKSYAKQKDSEALDLNDRLKEEQEKVKAMERQLAEMGRQVTARANRSGGQYDLGLVDDLSKQTALAQEYKEQVQELEQLLQDLESPDDKDSRQRRVASPKTHRTLMEAQRELRKARNQVKQMDRLQEERDRMKSELKFAEQRATKLAEENKKLAEDLAETTSKVSDLKNEVADLKVESRQKDRELKKLRTEHDHLKENAKNRYVEAEEVLRKKNETIEHLKSEIESLKVADFGSRLSARAKAVEEKLRSRSDTIKVPERDDALKFIETAEEESTLLHDQLKNLRRVSIEKGLIPAHGRTRRHNSREGSMKGKEKDTHDIVAADKEKPVSSHALREKFESDQEKRSSSALSDRGNLQDTQSSSSRSQDKTSVTGSRGKEDAGRKPVRPSSSIAPPSSATLNDDEVLITSRPRPWAISSELNKASSSRPVPAEKESPGIDLVKNHFARLGGPDVHNSSMFSMNASKMTLPAERRAAAIARLQHKRVQRERGTAQADRNKENVRP